MLRGIEFLEIGKLSPNPLLANGLWASEDSQYGSSAVMSPTFEETPYGIEALAVILLSIKKGTVLDRSHRFRATPAWFIPQ
jgi:hypothetical protein